MTVATDAWLQSALGSLRIPNVSIGCRVIAPGDERALTPEETGGICNSIVERRRASGAARIVARQLLADSGFAPGPIPRSAAGAPIWPAGVVGSLAHDRRIAVAAIAPARCMAALGIDIEPAERLPEEVFDLVVTPEERATIGGDLVAARLLFTAKEAVYKALYPLDQTFLDHHDIRIDLQNSRGLVRNGRVVHLRHCAAHHLIVVAFLPVHPPTA